MLVGFVILSHSAPGQLMRLIEGLNREYDYPPISCHHDFSQHSFTTDDFSQNVSFVRPSISTGWAKWGTVQGALEAIKFLYEKANPDWFFLLSAADYPIMGGSEVKKALRESGCDAFVDARPLDATSQPACAVRGRQNPKLDQFNRESTYKGKRRFYKSRQFWFPVLRLKPRLRIGRVTYWPDWEAPNPYRDWPCFYGDFWFCGNAKLANILIRPKPKHLDLRRHLRDRTQPDECYFQTVIMNEPNLTVCLDNKRFTEWNEGGAHPMDLEESQLGEMYESGAFFARKFSSDSILPKKIDAYLAHSKAT